MLKLERFKYNITLFKVTMTKSQLLHQEPIRKIFGKIEIKTIIKKMNGEKLKQTERNYLSRSIRPKLIAANILCQENILSEINKAKRDNDLFISYNLAAYGYELILSYKKSFRKIPIEELIAEILVKYPRARFIESIPILIVKNKIDKFKLLEIASNYGIKNKIGYLLETALLLKKMPYLEDIYNYLKSNKEKEESFLAEGDYEFLKRTSPKRVKDWNLLGRFFDEDFKKNAEVYT